MEAALMEPRLIEVTDGQVVTAGVSVTWHNYDNLGIPHQCAVIKRKEKCLNKDIRHHKLLQSSLRGKQVRLDT